MKRTTLFTRYPTRGLALALVMLLVSLRAVAGAPGPVHQGDVGAQGVMLGTAFTYQGRLFVGGDNPTPTEGYFDFEFRLYDAESDGNQIGDPMIRENVYLANGVFAVKLDFGPNAFTGEARWLQIGVREAGESEFTYLNGRQELTPTPYALALPGLRTQTIDSAGNPLDSPNVIGGFVGNTVTEGVIGATIDGGGTAPDAQTYRHNKVTDDFGAVGGGLDNQAGSTSGTTQDARYATVGGGFANYAMAVGAIIAGGSANVVWEDAKYATIGGGSNNRVSGEYTTIGGGHINRVSGTDATISGGSDNQAMEEGATVGGGYDNVSDGAFSTVGGGVYNAANGRISTVGGGGGNEASEWSSTVGGGVNNTASGGNATIAGGGWNTASVGIATVGGGAQNIASGTGATIPGGQLNVAAGKYSFAAGYRAKIEKNHDGAFLFADENDYDFTSQHANEFAIRATGGARFVTGIDHQTGDPTAGVVLWQGGNSWAPMSDQNAKDNITPVDGRDVLSNLVEIPIMTWNYKSQDPAVRHIGPMAQDFHTTFGVGEDDKHISTVDADGVALVAIQGLYQIVREQETRINSLTQKNADLESQIADLESPMEQKASPVSGFPLANWPVLGVLLVSVGAVWWRRQGENR